MPFRIVFVAEAAEDLRRLGAFCRSAVKDAIERHLRHQPELTSRSRIKRLEDTDSPQYRLRVGHPRVFYDISGNDVVVLCILPKEDSIPWLRVRERRKE